MSVAIRHMIYIVHGLEEMQKHVLCVCKMLPNLLSLSRLFSFALSVGSGLWYYISVQVVHVLPLNIAHTDTVIHVIMLST
jgi:hypothetical protein